MKTFKKVMSLTLAAAMVFSAATVYAATETEINTAPGYPVATRFDEIFTSFPVGGTSTVYAWAYDADGNRIETGEYGDMEIYHNGVGFMRCDTDFRGEGSHIGTCTPRNTTSTSGAAIITARNVLPAGEDPNLRKLDYCFAVMTPEAVPVAGVNILKDVTYMIPGGTERLYADMVPLAANNQGKTWTSNNDNIAKVDSFGLVTAVGVGTAVITVKSNEGGFIDTCTVNVVADPVPVTRITVDREVVYTGNNDFSRVTATIEPYNATNQNIVWLPDPEVPSVVVLRNGTVVTNSVIFLGQAVDDGIFSEGAFLRAASAEDLNINDTFEVVGSVYGRTGNIFFQSAETNLINLPVGNSRKLIGYGLTQASNNGFYSSVQSGTWVSSNPEIASIDSKGVITANTEGKVTLTYMPFGHTQRTTAANTKVTVDVNVIPAEPNAIPVESLSFEREAVSVCTGDMYAARPVFHPANASDKALVWSSSNERVAVVGQDGKTMVRSAGTAVITAATPDGSIKAQYTVTGVKWSEYTAATSINLSAGDNTVGVGGLLKINVETTPTVVTPGIIWTSSNQSVARVSAEGVVYGVSQGTVTITARPFYPGTLTKTINITVGAHVAATELTLSETSVEMFTGDTTALQANLMPAEATCKELSWYSSNPEVAKVDQNGNVTAISAGETNIIVRNCEGLEAVCAVSVTVRTGAPTAIKVLNPALVNLQKGKNVQIELGFTPVSSAGNTTVTWTSSNDTIAKVSSNGVVTGLKAGTVVITARTSEGLTATVVVKVTN